MTSSTRQPICLRHAAQHVPDMHTSGWVISGTCILLLHHPHLLLPRLCSAYRQPAARCLRNLQIRDTRGLDENPPRTDTRLPLAVHVVDLCYPVVDLWHWWPRGLMTADGGKMNGLLVWLAFSESEEELARGVHSMTNMTVVEEHGCFCSWPPAVSKLTRPDSLEDISVGR